LVREFEFLILSGVSCRIRGTRLLISASDLFYAVDVWASSPTWQEVPRSAERTPVRVCMLCGGGCGIAINGIDLVAFSVLDKVNFGVLTVVNFKC